MNKQTRLIVTGGLMAAIIILGTMIFHIPVPIQSGYVNLGDGFIVITAFLMGPFAAIPAAIGSALADVLSGYAAYAPATFIIKGLMGFAAGFLFTKIKIHVLIQTILAAVISEAIMVFGYFLFELLFMKLGAGAYADMIPNAFQGIAAIVIAVVFVPVIKTAFQKMNLLSK